MVPLPPLSLSWSLFFFPSLPQDIRTTVRELEQVAREIFTATQAVHHTKLQDSESMDKPETKLTDYGGTSVAARDTLKYGHFKVIMQYITALTSGMLNIVGERERAKLSA